LPFFSSEQTGETEWFNSSGPAQFDNNLEYLCSGAFGGDNAYVIFSIIKTNDDVLMLFKNSSITKLYTC
jgi:hypothetical protein